MKKDTIAVVFAFSLFLTSQPIFADDAGGEHRLKLSRGPATAFVYGASVDGEPPRPQSQTVFWNLSGLRIGGLKSSDLSISIKLPLEKKGFDLDELKDRILGSATGRLSFTKRQPGGTDFSFEPFLDLKEDDGKYYPELGITLTFSFSNI